MDVQFEGIVRLRGSPETVERTLSELRRKGAEFGIERTPPWRPFPFPGLLPDRLEAIVLRDSRFVKKHAQAINAGLPSKVRAPVKFVPDYGIAGGRKYMHLHVGNKILPLNETVFNGMLIEAGKELTRRGAGNQI